MVRREDIPWEDLQRLNAQGWSYRRLAEKYGVSDPRVVTSARVLMLLGALLCAGLAASGLFLPYFGALPKLLLLFAGLAVSVLLILRPCARLRRSCNKERL